MPEEVSSSSAKRLLRTPGTPNTPIYQSSAVPRIYRSFRGGNIVLFDIANGYEAFSLRQVTDKIEYSASSIYLDFKNKEELIEAIRAETFDELIARMDRLEASPITKPTTGSPPPASPTSTAARPSTKSVGSKPSPSPA